MYHYIFPKIKHIEDVIWAIQDSPEFIIADRGHYQIINYNVNMPDSFPPVYTAGGSASNREKETLRKSLRRECRGIVFDKDGKLIARRYHKFFNINERDETLLHKIDFEKPHVILEKLDGSMITPIPYDKDHWFLGTKMGDTEVAEAPNKFVQDKSNYRSFINSCMDTGTTPIFEWCSRKNRIVIDYPEDRLILTAIRDNETGIYLDYPSMDGLAIWFNVDLVKAFPGTVESFKQLMEQTKDLKGSEGWVVRFNDGHMLKVKAEEYVGFHKAKESISYEKNIIQIILYNKIDDVKPFLQEADKERLDAYAYKVLEGIDKTVNRIHEKYLYIWNILSGSRKRFALEAAFHLPSAYRSIMFKFWDSGERLPKEAIGQELTRIILSNTGTQTKLEDVRFLWGGHRWNYIDQEE